MTGENLEDLRREHHVPGQYRNRVKEELASNFKIRRIGLDSENHEVLLSEEQRESHIHILGAPGQGKSKLLELLIRQDIEAGYGACLLDPSDNGDTMRRILAWCVQRGFKKVCIIDPHDRWEFVPQIVPRHNLMQTIRVLFNTKEWSDTPQIQRYFPAIISAIKESGNTLAELKYFMANDDAVYNSRRNEMLSSLNRMDKYRVSLESVFRRSPTTFDNTFGSTLNRLNPFLERTMELILGGTRGIPFASMIASGWLILVNLDSIGVDNDYDEPHQKLLGTLVIHEIIDSIHKLRAKKKWKGVYYLYIDEVGDYATRNLANILAKKRKSGLRLTLGHQNLFQVEDRYVQEAIMMGANIKFLFQTPNPEDRLKMIRAMYGGELKDRDVSYYLSALAKQHAVVKIIKQPTTTVRLDDVPDANVSDEEISKFKNFIYNRDLKKGWYATPDAALEQINGRFTTKGYNPRSSKRRTSNDSGATSETETGRTSGQRVKTVFTKARDETA